VYVDWGDNLAALYPEARGAREQYALRAKPLILGSYDHVDFDRVARIGTLDVFTPRGTVARGIFDCQKTGPSASHFEIEVMLRQAGILKSAFVEIVRGQRIVAQRWDTLPGTGQPGLFLVSADTSRAGPKADSLAMPVQRGQSLRLRGVGETFDRDGADDILVSLCLESSHCQRQSALSSR
jgi:hypothetical protein